MTTIDHIATVPTLDGSVEALAQVIVTLRYGAALPDPDDTNVCLWASRAVGANRREPVSLHGPSECGGMCGSTLSPPWLGADGWWIVATVDDARTNLLGEEHRVFVNPSTEKIGYASLGVEQRDRPVCVFPARACTIAMLWAMGGDRVVMSLTERGTAAPHAA